MPPSEPPTFGGNKPERLACPPGSVMLFRSDLWHGAADNTHAGGKQRYIMQIHYGNDCALHSAPSSPPRPSPLGLTNNRAFSDVQRLYPEFGTAGAYSSTVLAALTRRQEQLLGRREPWYRQGSYHYPLIDPQASRL